MDAASSYKFFSSKVAARTPEAIRELNTQILKIAINEATYGDGDGHQPTYPSHDIVALGVYNEDFPEAKLDYDQMVEYLTGYALAKGNFSEKRYWIWVPLVKRYLAFPKLNGAPFHGALQWALADKIGELLKAGKDSNLISFMRSAGYEVIKEHREFMFAKGYTLAQPDFVKPIKDDIEVIIGLMKQFTGVRDPVFTQEFQSLEFQKVGSLSARSAAPPVVSGRSRTMARK